MESLINPNVAGLLELGALFLLVLAGWQVYNLPFNLWALVILAVGVIPFIVAVRKSKKLVYLVVAIASVVIGSSFLFRVKPGGSRP